VSVAETLLVYVGVPLAIVLVMALLVFRPGGHKRPRYRPGQPWEHEPVWYEPHPEHSAPAGHGADHAALPSAQRPALTTGATAAPPRSGGPLGGARGTW
jgi:hypothetical protein